jgi:hypothetical protein
MPPPAIAQPTGDGHRHTQELPVLEVSEQINADQSNWQDLVRIARSMREEKSMTEDMIYVIFADDGCHTLIEGCYVSKQKAELRLAVLNAKRELALAEARERNPEHDLDHNAFGSIYYSLMDEKLIR